MGESYPLQGGGTSGGSGPALSNTVTGPDTSGASATAGVAATASRGDHDHGLPNLQSLTDSSTVTGPPAPGSAAVVGAAGTFSDGAHAHGLPAIKTVVGGVISGNVTTTAAYYPLYANSNESTVNNATVIPYAFTAKNLSVQIFSDALANTHTFSLTVKISSAPGTVADSSITTGNITGGTTGVVQDTTHSYAASANYLICVELIANAGSSSSAVVLNWSVELDQT